MAHAWIFYELDKYIYLIILPTMFSVTYNIQIPFCYRSFIKTFVRSITIIWLQNLITSTCTVLNDATFHTSVIDKRNGSERPIIYHWQLSIVYQQIKPARSLYRLGNLHLSSRCHNERYGWTRRSHLGYKRCLCNRSLTNVQYTIAIDRFDRSRV